MLVEKMSEDYQKEVADPIFRTNCLKDTNPKDAVGIAKAPLSTVPANVLMEIGLAMMEGARKYGRHNYRDTGVRASVYYDALMRHMMAWWEGEDYDRDSGLSHVVKALATLVVLRDAQFLGNLEDDRPPRVKSSWVNHFNAHARELIEKYPEAKEAFTEKNAPRLAEDTLWQVTYTQDTTKS